MPECYTITYGVLHIKDPFSLFILEQIQIKDHRKNKTWMDVISQAISVYLLVSRFNGYQRTDITFQQGLIFLREQ